MSAAAADPFLARTRQALARIAEREPRLHAFIRVMREEALAAASESDQRLLKGALGGPLDGCVVGIKDNIDIAGLPTSGGIAHYRDSIAQSDAAVVAQLRRQGAVLIGKTNLHEAALGATSDNPWFGRCENPLREGYTSGGSSGGSAAAVAAGFCGLALGTDTMGSVRIPAAYCGIAGFKPSRGALSLGGVMPLSPTLDHLGLLAPTAADLSRAWHALQGEGEMQTALGFKGRRVGMLPGLLGVEVVDGVERMMDQALACLRDAGAILVEASLPLEVVALRRDAFLLCEIEGAAVHAAALAADPEGFSPPLRKLLAYGARQDPATVAETRKRLAAAADTLHNCLQGLDLLVLPTCPQAAFAHGAPVPLNQADFTVPANLAGAPALSLPWGADAAGLPLGLQLIARPGMDTLLLRLGSLLEALRP
ncbi:MAG TPA: amidase [Burkholderiales bacterium]|nr:amidase [Burkholderiales bacterium]